MIVIDPNNLLSQFTKILYTQSQLTRNLFTSFYTYTGCPQLKDHHYCTVRHPVYCCSIPQNFPNANVALFNGGHLTDCHCNFLRLSAHYRFFGRSTKILGYRTLNYADYAIGLNTGAYT
uniref:Uncharacterized protein n=1 Tax=Cacopsylla melanoneura TaxID=428564 RepID=A0A8D8YPD8_9HEMI